MKSFFRKAPAAPVSSVWPARQRAIAYVQVGDLMEMWVRRRQANFAACEFCRTVNHRTDARCHTCGGAIAASHEPEIPPQKQSRRARARSADARSLGHVMRLAILPPLLLFVAFAAWLAWRVPAPVQRPAAVAASASAPASVPQRTAPAMGPALAADLGLSDNEVLLSAGSTPPAVEPPADVSDAAPSPMASTTRSRKAAAQASVRQMEDPLASCNGSNFFARAICINSRCADPKVAHMGQCREAIRQRQIDEARRNPSLMG